MSFDRIVVSSVDVVDPYSVRAERLAEERQSLVLGEAMPQPSGLDEVFQSNVLEIHGCRRLDELAADIPSVEEMIHLSRWFDHSSHLVHGEMRVGYPVKRVYAEHVVDRGWLEGQTLEGSV